MRLRRLDLLRYGHFTDRLLSLPAGKTDLHIVFGPNEAGKSTALSAIEDLLFGIHGQTPYGFLHGYNEMRVGAVLENGSDRLEVLRRKGNKDTLLGPDGLTIAGGEGVLRPYLAGADRAFFERMFSLDHTRLEAGGREILQARDDIGQMLFSAGAGIARLRERLHALSAEADELWSPGRRSKRRQFAIVGDALEEAQRDLRDHTLSAAKWQEAKRACEEAEETYKRIEEAFSEGTAKRNCLSRIRRVCRDVRRKQELDGLLAELGEVVALPEDAGALVAEAEGKDTEAAAGINALKDQLRQDEETLDDLTYDADVIQRARDIRQACERRIVIRDEKAHLPKREAELNAAEATLRADAAELGWTGDDPAALVERIPPRPAVSVVRTLLSRKGELEGNVSGKARLLEEAMEQHDKLKAALDRAGEPADPSRLALSVKAVRQQGDITGRVRNAERELKDAERIVRRRQEFLHPGVADESALIRMIVPTRAQVQEHIEARRDWSRRLRETRERTVAIRQERDGASAALKQALRDERVVTLETLTQARARRDALWRLVKRSYVDGRPIPDDEAEAFEQEIEDLAGAFEPAVSRADDLADRRFDHAEAAGRIAEINRKLGEQETLLEQAEKSEADLAEEDKLLSTRWASLWAGAPFDPLAPETMLEWLGARNVVLEAIDARESAGTVLTAIRGQELEVWQQLLAELSALGVEVTAFENDSLAIVVERSAEELQARQAEMERKSQLEADIEDEAETVARRQRELDTARRTVTAWHEGWTAALDALGLAADTPAEAVGTQIDIIDQMRVTAGRIHSLRHDRIEKIQRDAADFAKQVGELACIIAPDLNDLAADDAVLELESRLDEAERIQDLRRRQEEKVDDLRRRIGVLEGQRRDLTASILHLKQATGVDEPEALKAAVERSDRQRSLQVERDQIIGVLRADGDGKSIEELEGECEGLEIDVVVAREESVQSQLNDLRQQLSDAAESRSQTRQAFRAIGGDDTAAKAATAREAALAEMAVVAERYIRIKTSARLLHWAIDRYRREKRGPLLEHAGKLFQIMTGGSFVTLQVAWDEHDNAHLTGVRQDGTIVPVSGMSTGSADQLYLALRIASIEDYLDRAEAMPFVADDLFVNFDDERAAAGFRLLARLAEKTQVLFFTHHRHLVEIAQETLGDLAGLVSLDDRPDEAAA